MRQLIFFMAMLGVIFGEAVAQPSAVTLDSCRVMAIMHNRQLQIKREEVASARYRQREALAAYLPAVDFAGGYTYNQKNISIFDSDQLLPTKTFNASTGNYEFNIARNPSTGEPLKSPDGQYVPETVALIPKESMTYDIHNVFFGAVTITQPVYMGGKIVAMNKLTEYARQLAQNLHDSQAEEVICAVDAAYWQVVSLSAKHRLVTSYVALLDTLCHNVEAMRQEGVATKSDLLGVSVKLNEAQVDLTRVENALTLSRMSLAQLCGLAVNTKLTLVDETEFSDPDDDWPTLGYDLDQVYSRRHDLRALALGVEMQRQQQRIVLSGMLPNVALVGAYSFSNPNMFDGFRKRFDGAFSIGAMVTIPLWHWGGDYNKYRAAKARVEIARLRLDDARSQVALQVAQASFKASEADKTLQASETNLSKADENLRMAQISFKEGIITPDKVMEAQTAWLKAKSQLIDAQIDVRLCRTYLSKALGTMPINISDYKL